MSIALGFRATRIAGLMAELVEHVEHPIPAPIVGAVLDKVVGQHRRRITTSPIMSRARTAVARLVGLTSSTVLKGRSMFRDPHMIMFGLLVTCAAAAWTMVLIL